MGIGRSAFRGSGSSSCAAWPGEACLGRAAPSLSSLGITSGTQVGILFDAVQPQSANNPTVTINDLTLKLYNGSTVLFTASGTFSDLLTNPGNGTSDYLFTLDSPQAAAFDLAIDGNLSDTIALDSTISFPNQSAGPDSYTLINTSAPPPPPPPLPEPASLGLLVAGLVGMGVIGRRSRRVDLAFHWRLAHPPRAPKPHMRNPEALRAPLAGQPGVGEKGRFGNPRSAPIWHT